MSADIFLEEVTALLPTLRAFGRSLCGDRAKADDLVQETVTKAWINREQFRPCSNLKTWLFVILRNSYFTDLRRHRREVEDPEGIYAACLTIDPDHDGQLDVQDLNRLLQRLSPPRREALLLVHAAGLSLAEAAKICGVPVGTIKSRIFRARDQLLEWLDEDAASTRTRPRPRHSLRSRHPWVPAQ